MEDRLSKNTELVTAFDALEFFLGGDFKNSFAFAADTFNAERPTKFL